MSSESGGLDPQERPIETSADFAREREPIHTVLETVAVATNTPVLDLEPLVQTLDPEALNSLFAGDKGAAGRNTELTFEYEACTVTVSSDGTVRVC